MSLWYAWDRTIINLMVVAKKVSLEYKLDPSSKLAGFIEWYKNRYRTINPDTGRKRVGNAKKVIQDFLEATLTGIQSKEYNEFIDCVKEFKEDTKLPKELQSAKNNLSAEEYENFKSLYEKVKKEEEKNKAD